MFFRHYRYPNLIVRRIQRRLNQIVGWARTHKNRRYVREEAETKARAILEEEFPKLLRHVYRVRVLRDIPDAVKLGDFEVDDLREELILPKLKDFRGILDDALR